MTFLPVVARELRVASRRSSTYWTRCGAAFAILAIGTWAFLAMWNQSPREVAMGLFTVLTGFSLLYGLLSGMRFTSDSLSEEKRQGTLGLLFLTDLKGYDVVLGKLAATSVDALYGMLALLPMSAVPLLLGGVTLGEFGRTSLAALNALFFSLSVGLCVSACVRSSRKAISGTLCLILLITAGLPALGAYLGVIGKVRQMHPAFYFPSPGFTYAAGFETLSRAGVRGYWLSLGLVHLMGWLALAVGSLIVPVTWQDRPPGAHRVRWRERWRVWVLGRAGDRAAYRRRLLDVNAYLWLAARVPSRAIYPWAGLVVGATVWIWGYAKFKSDWLNEGVYVTTALFLCLLVKAWVASEASRQLAEDRQNGTLELLLSTPLAVREILRGQFLALQRQCLAPVVLVLMILIALMVATLRQLNTFDTGRGAWALFWAGLIIMLVADLFALYWVGMWDGLTSVNPNRAAGNAATRILVVPWLGMALLIVYVSLTSMTNANGTFFLMAWLILGLGTDLFYSAWARQKLLRQFRAAAARKYDPRPGLPVRIALALGRLLARARRR